MFGVCLFMGSVASRFLSRWMFQEHTLSMPYSYVKPLLCKDTHCTLVLQYYLLIVIKPICHEHNVLSMPCLPSLDKTMSAPFPWHTGRKTCGRRGLAHTAMMLISERWGLTLSSNSISFFRCFTDSNGKLLSPTCGGKNQGELWGTKRKSNLIEIFQGQVDEVPVN